MRYLIFLLLPFIGISQMTDKFMKFGEEAFFPTTLTGVIHVWYQDYNGASGDGTAVTQWNDIVGSANATEATLSPEIDTSAGQDELYFTGSDYMTAQADNGDMDFTPGTDDFWVVIKLGAQVSTANSGCWFCKSTGSGSTRQYQFGVNSSGVLQVYIGGQTVDGSAGTVDDNAFIIANVGTGAVDLWLDGTKEINNITLTGTATTSQAVEIGSRQGGGYNPEGNIQWIAVGTGTLSAQEVIDLNALYDEN